MTSVTQEVALWVAGTFLTLGYLGFLPGVTTGVQTLGLSSAEQAARLFGLFHVSIVHNLVHLVIGLVGLAVAGVDRYARGFLALTGVALMMLLIYGQLAARPIPPSLIPLDAADVWLHTVLAIAMFAAAVLAPAGERGSRPHDVATRQH
ncbi:DUF4383 domain-containing protein [Kribbella sp. NBC_00889]|uniref:DUF4383 domain-containing protein n=1 Tax=Kribbella sp. NBC_00889 TaxID=2975974 RepID=UPI0038684F73|nr:DUF4383 domain-containing protein [Kribbella sp. NBC_00889]